MTPAFTPVFPMPSVISLTNVSVTQTAFEDAPVMIQADVDERWRYYEQLASMERTTRAQEDPS